MKNRKKKRRIKKFANQYDSFQRMWIMILIGILCFSIFMVGVQGVTLFLRGKITKDFPNEENTPPTEEVEENSVALKESDKVGKEYLAETLFLGDSNTVRFMNFTDEDGMTYTSKENTIAVVGMGVQAMDSLKCMQFSTGTFTMPEAVKILQPKRIIVTMGTNNLTGDNTEEAKKEFIAAYTEQLQKIQEAYPAVDIIVNSIPPLSQKTIYKNLSIEQIQAWNKAIYEMCNTNNWHYLDSYSVLADESGYAKEEDIDSDGLHLSAKGVGEFFQYVRMHAYVHEDTRPQPLNQIPVVIGPVTDLYKTDPLNGKEFDSSVLHPIEPSKQPLPEFSPQTEETPVPPVFEMPQEALPEPGNANGESSEPVTPTPEESSPQEPIEPSPEVPVDPDSSEMNEQG